MIDLREGRPPPLPLVDRCLLNDEVSSGRLWCMETRHAPLRALLDPVRRKLPGHPTLERVAATGRLVADDDFRMQIPGSGRPMAAWALNAGPMGRATELSGDRFWTAQRELNAFRSQAGGRAAASVLGRLDEGCDSRMRLNARMDSEGSRLSVCRIALIILTPPHPGPLPPGERGSLLNFLPSAPGCGARRR